VSTTALDTGHSRPKENAAGEELPVLQRPEWTDVRFADGYSLTVRVIGDGIVHSRPSGRAVLPALHDALDLITRIRTEVIGDDRPYVHIADYGELSGASSQARRAFSEYMRSRSQLAGLVFCGVSPTFRMSIQIGSRLGIVRARVAIADTLDDAIAMASELLDEARRRSDDSTSERTPSPARAARRNEGVVTNPEWDYVAEGFNLSWEVIDGHIAHGRATGYLGLEHIGPVFEAIRRVAGHISSSGASISGLIDLSGLDGITVSGRREFVRAYRALQQDEPIRQLVFYGSNVLLRGALAIWRPLTPLPVVVTRDFASAIRAIRGGDGKAARRVRRPGLLARLRHRKPDSTNDERIDDLLRFLGTIDWVHDGVVEDREQIDPNDPLVPVYDAITLLKSELDQQLKDRRAAEEALRESEERYRTILDNIVDGYYEVELDGRLVFCNDSMLRILGYRRGEIEGLRTRSYVSRGHFRRVIAEVERVFETGRPARALDWELIRKDGQRIAVEASISLVRDRDGRKVGFRGIVRDITERVHAEREREELEDKLRHAQRMEAIGTLAGGIAHNFNNLLMGIQGNVSLIRRELESGSPQDRRLETVEELVQGGSKLTAQLLGYARAGRYEVRPIDLNSLVQETAETFGLARKEIRFNLELAADPMPVRADRGQIEQVLLNLFVNAADAMPQGGDLHVSTALTSIEALEGRPYQPKRGSYVRLEVRDTGIGMSSETVQRVFDPFFTTKGMSGGTGLGLASVYGTVKAHGGYIEVSSEVGTGSTFSVFLPLTEDAVLQTEVEKEELVLGKGNVLVVDDDDAVLEACASILTHLHYSPICAATGREALAEFRRHADEIDLVILDMVLPDISGSEVFDTLKQINPGAKVLLASGYSIEGQAARILERGCDDFIQKPFTIEQLSQKIGAVLNGA
jgi:PAS domain S-box-containing protein